jgi:NADP-dependent 3-hydroxy acid dehydrogenase YdfG
MVRTNLMVAGGISREKSDDFFAKYAHLEPNDVAEAVLYAIGTPPHVQVSQIMW